MDKISLSTESVQCLALAFQRVDNIKSGDSLALGMLGVGDGITDDILEEDLENTASLLVDQTRDALDTATTGKATNRGLGNALDIIAKDLAMALGTALSESFASFTTS